MHLELPPYLTAELPGIGGRLKDRPEDFVVEEVPAYEPCGAGEHLYLWIEKTDVAADHLLNHVARTLGMSVRDVGMAGIKDRRAITRQYVSVPATCEPRIARLETDKIRVLRRARHRNKLRTGHLRGNRFSILVRAVDPDAAAQRTDHPRGEAARFSELLRRPAIRPRPGDVRLRLEIDSRRRTARDDPGAPSAVCITVVLVGRSVGPFQRRPGGAAFGRFVRDRFAG